ncbi:MAG: hypothetical protein ACK2T5_13955 [Anaerolineales bacterium]|jgi:uncharacterized membrane protein YeaQ/YmgE (transglycosylase-associated protein family)
MEIILVIGAMALVGLLIGFIAGLIWKENRPIGVNGDYLVAIISAIIIGLMDWYLIPAMGFSETMKWLGVMLEPALGALLILWLIRVARRNR